MEILDVIDDILVHESMILPKVEPEEGFTFEEQLFERLAKLIFLDLDIDRLNDEQLQELINMIEILEQDDVQEVRKPRLAKRTPASKNQYSKKWYRANRTEIKRRKAKMKRSSQGRKRAKMRARLAKIGKTATGRKKVRYHVRKKSKERMKNER